MGRGKIQKLYTLVSSVSRNESTLNLVHSSLCYSSLYHSARHNLDHARRPFSSLTSSRSLKTSHPSSYVKIHPTSLIRSWSSTLNLFLNCLHYLSRFTRKPLLTRSVSSIKTPSSRDPYELLLVPSFTPPSSPSTHLSTTPLQSAIRRTTP